MMSPETLIADECAKWGWTVDEALRINRRPQQIRIRAALARRLHAAGHKVMTIAAAMHADHSTVSWLLRTAYPNPRPPIRPGQIHPDVRAAATALEIQGVHLDDALNWRIRNRIALADRERILVWLVTYKPGWSTNELAELMGGQNHSSIGGMLRTLKQRAKGAKAA